MTTCDSDPENRLDIVASWIVLIKKFVSGQIAPSEYRCLATDPELTPGVWADNSPFYPILAQLRHDANEFVSSDESRGPEDMTPEQLSMRASFALDTLAVTVAYFSHVQRRGQKPVG